MTYLMQITHHPPDLGNGKMKIEGEDSCRGIHLVVRACTSAFDELRVRRHSTTVKVYDLLM
jgi:hypothetical protein